MLNNGEERGEAGEGLIRNIHFGSAVVPLKKLPAPRLHRPGPREVILAPIRLLPFDHQDLSRATERSLFPAPLQF